jgi:hypothetical protein
VRKELTCPAVVAGRKYNATVEFTNLEATPMTQCHWRLSERTLADFPGGYGFVYEDGVLDVFTDEKADRGVKAKLIGRSAPRTIGAGETVRLRYEIVFDEKLAGLGEDGRRKRIRPVCDVYFVWAGRPYHADAWLPRVAVLGGEKQ